MNIIIFFNGWGMDENIFEKLENETNYKILNVSFPYKIDKVKLENYKTKIFVGWSFGVYYMCNFLNKNNDISYEDVISINGTPEIIGKNGIPEKIYELTLKHMNEENLEKFYINMGCKFLTKRKKIDELIYELQYLKDNYNPQENKVLKAIISTNDKIIKSKNQNEYYESKGIEIKKVDGGHYIFSQLKSWEDILR